MEQVLTFVLLPRMVSWCDHEPIINNNNDDINYHDNDHDDDNSDHIFINDDDTSAVTSVPSVFFAFLLFPFAFLR